MLDILYIKNMNYLSSVVNNVKKYTEQYLNNDYNQIKHKISNIEEDYIQIKSFNMKKSKSCNSFYTENKTNKINNLELTNKLDIINYKINDINNKLEIYKNSKNKIFENNFIFILKHVGVGLVLSSVIYRFYIKC